ncbi:MAG: hypothetical protein HQL16_04630 [Candidatus Omnitrophica bacterium]|nr:hypothetical protein [Candidatus Omnitrophota bacterium]
MNKIFLFATFFTGVFLSWPAFCAPRDATLSPLIEIYSNGHKYLSFEAYQEKRKEGRTLVLGADGKFTEEKGVPIDIALPLRVDDPDTLAYKAVRGVGVNEPLFKAIYGNAPGNKEKTLIVSSPQELEVKLEEGLSKTPGALLMVAQDSKVRLMGLKPLICRGSID